MSKIRLLVWPKSQIVLSIRSEQPFKFQPQYRRRATYWEASVGHANLDLTGDDLANPQLEAYFEGLVPDALLRLRTNEPDLSEFLSDDIPDRFPVLVHKLEYDPVYNQLFMNIAPVEPRLVENYPLRHMVREDGLTQIY